MVDKTPMLSSQITFTPIIVQTGLADTDHFRAPRLRRHSDNAEFYRISTVGMHAYDIEDVAVALRDGKHFDKTLPTDANGQRLLGLLHAHIDEHFGQTVSQAVEIQVVVRIS